MNELLTRTERDRLTDSLRRNAQQDWALLMDEETCFVGDSAELPTDDEVISAVRSVPCHY